MQDLVPCAYRRKSTRQNFCFVKLQRISELLLAWLSSSSPSAIFISPMPRFFKMFIILNPCAHCSIVISYLLIRVANSVISSMDEAPIFCFQSFIRYCTFLRYLSPLLFDSWLCLLDVLYR